MANFATHLAVGIIGSGALSTLTLASGLVTPGEIVTLAVAGAVGGILPDIDLGNSRPSQALFTGLGLLIAFAVMFHVAPTWSIAEMWLLWCGTFLAIRYAGHNIFHNISRHRGIFHSVLAGLFFACVTAIFFRHGLGYGGGVAWLGGAFVLLGFLIHLVLDEIYSVDVYNERVKASFGTAMKFADFQRPAASLAMAAALAGAFYLAPPTEEFLSVVTTKPLWLSFQEKLLPPDQNWFGVAADLQKVVAGWLGRAQ